MVLGALVMLCMTKPDFLKIIFCPKNGENRPSLGFFECMGKFSFFSQFFNFISIWSIMKVCIIVIAVCLNKLDIEVFCKVILVFWMSLTRHAQSTQNKFAYLCNISIKAWARKLIFCLKINPKSFLQDDSVTLGVRSQTGPKHQKQPVNKIFATFQGKQER